MTAILGSLGLERRTLFDRDGVAIGNVEEPCGVLPAARRTGRAPVPT